jgi:hypothetical protein
MDLQGSPEDDLSEVPPPKPDAFPRKPSTTMSYLLKPGSIQCFY